MEKVCSSKVLSEEDQYCEDNFSSTVHHDSQGRFVTEAVSILGLKWVPPSDSFCFEVTLPASSKVVTKRVILSEISKSFDLLGWLSPVLVRAKLMLQDLWIQSVDWGIPLTGDLLDQWQLLREQLPELAQIRIPRWFGSSAQTAWELHRFLDASQRAFVATAYMVVPGEKSTLIMSKTKVLPIKTESLPRLELCGAVFLTRLFKHLLDGVLLKPVAVYCWTDSKWRHVRSEDTPTDCATKGFTPEQLLQSSLWWEGPEWIRNDWTADRSNYTAKTTLSTVLAQVALEESAEKDDVSPPLVCLEKYSHFSKIIRVLACAFRWRRNAAKSKGDRCAGPFITEELDDTRVGLLR
ncbi:uncharacterized protein LOC103317082 [Nasonia vitripennis]|uniref:Uncharacterized protein n=1 Tax=Nasonia vitripennis TaxID=7425 RepID=A0A7M7H7G0_NASVI|nr:uncharacterized protein LOC103317082 [Nasonia vitripennis]